MAYTLTSNTKTNHFVHYNLFILNTGKSKQKLRNQYYVIKKNLKKKKSRFRIKFIHLKRNSKTMRSTKDTKQTGKSKILLKEKEKLPFDECYELISHKKQKDVATKNTQTHEYP